MKEPSSFIPRLESLRGIAALTVVGYHVNEQLSASHAHDWLDGIVCRVITGLSNGNGAVVVFFVLSGFVLARSLDRDSDPIRFLRHRAFRLLPAAAATILLLTVLHWQFGIYVGFEGSFDPFNVILNMLMIKSDINGVMWSTTVECAATPLILLSAWLFRKHGEQPLWWLVAIMFGLSFWGPYVNLLGGFTTLAPFYAFIVGTLIHFRGARIPTLLSPGMANVAGIVAIAIFCYLGASKRPALTLMLECVSATILIALIAYRPAMNLFKPLDFKLVRFYGRISYSFYLLHLLGMKSAFRVVGPETWIALGMPLSLATVLTTIVSILLTTPLAWLFWRYVETPAVGYGRVLDKTPAPLVAKKPA